MADFNHSLRRSIQPGVVPAEWECIKCLKTGSVGEFHLFDCTSPASDKDVLDAIAGFRNIDTSFCETCQAPCFRPDDHK